MRDRDGYDREAERQQDDFEAFCNDEHFDPSEHDTPEFQAAFAAWKQEQDERAEDAAIERAMDRRAYGD